jgi:hypothetical protein
MKNRSINKLSNFKETELNLKNIKGGRESTYGRDGSGRRYEQWVEDGVIYRRYLDSVA